MLPSHIHSRNFTTGWARQTAMSMAVLCGLLAGCSSGTDQPAVSSWQVPAVPGTSAVVSVENQTLSASDMAQVMDPRPDPAYTLGPNDVIAVSVYQHPELSVPVAGTSGNVNGALITGDGSVELPLIGGIDVGGDTIAEARQAIATAYSSAVVSPKVAVQLVQAESLRYYLLGSFTDPGVKYPIHQLTLLDALALGGTVDISKADLYQAYVARGAVKLPVDLHALLVNGDLTQNITLASGDAVVIPSSNAENAFVLGAVGKPGAVPFLQGNLTLLQALSSSGFDLKSYAEARLSNIHIIRSQGRSGEFIIVNAQLILNGQAPSFALQPGDIVFVPPTAVASWNEVLNMALPTLQTISDLLSPFVQLKFLFQSTN